jgi:SAM-dependent methyltransferase
MKIILEPTGERVIEKAYQYSLGAYTIYAMHGASYRFVENLCTGKHVLDLGCGSGYGSHRIAHVANMVHGVDVAGDAVAYARENYQHPRLNYQMIDAGQTLPFPDAHFDVILSFQVIEHVSDDQQYLAEARRLLKPGGCIVVITPDRQHRLLPGQKPWNRWHLREYSMAELAQRISRHFIVERKLHMGAAWKIASIEIRRYRKTKWLTLPATLPIIPERLRRRTLDAIHQCLNVLNTRKTEHTRADIDYGFDESGFIISEAPPYPLNLIVVARRPHDPEDA